ncbi:MAG: glycosyltransferase, partial [Nitrospinaceae bacterium]|nr:glycosyltransferase [Nitrospinaceae bacterium]NIR53923.1 glycosyltransferase [Nitrospinaceae bacterium]NIS84341.1 glycosyltransferase [Nitrospinaceae bacterium]NIT81144.1 glycosyltransferase [Nitrospinaceae bacterium]NIU43426.1 glycosyltransferase [Nitrospinaceae bacterium]
ERIEELREVDPQRQWGRNLRNRVRENFAWDSVMHRYLELYRSLL